MPYFSFAIAFSLVWMDFWARVYNQTQPVYNDDRTGS